MMTEMAGSFFNVGSPGFVMLGLLFGGIVAFAGEKLLVTIGKGFYAAMFKTGMELAAILAVMSIAISLLVNIYKVAMGTIQ